MSRGKKPAASTVFGRPRQAMGMRSAQNQMPQSLAELINWDKPGFNKVQHPLHDPDWIWHSDLMRKIEEIRDLRERANNPESYRYESSQKERTEQVALMNAFKTPELPDSKIPWQSEEGVVGAKQIFGDGQTGWVPSFKLLEQTARTFESRGSGSAEPIRYRLERTGVNVREMFETSWQDVRMYDRNGESKGNFNVFLHQWKARKNQKNFKTAASITPWIDTLPEEDPTEQIQYMHGLLTRMQESKFEFCDITIGVEDNPKVYAALGAEFIEPSTNASRTTMSQFESACHAKWREVGFEESRPEYEKRLACLSTWEVYGGKERARYAAKMGWIDFNMYKGLEQYMERVGDGREDTPTYADLYDIGKKAPWHSDVIYGSERDWHLGDWMLYGAGAYLRVDLKKPLPPLEV